MFCKKCGQEVEGGFCSNCGANTNDGGSEKQTMKNVSKKKSIFKRWWFWVIIGIIVVFIALSGGNGESGDTGNNEEQTEKVTDAVSETELGAEDQATDIYSDKAYIFEAIGDNDDLPYTISPKAKTFISEHEDLFPASTAESVTEYVDESLEFRHISKNQNNCGDKLMLLNEAYVVSINETNLDNDTVFSEIQAVDEAENFYYIFYLGELTDVFKDDIIKVYATPLGMTSFSNVSGGSTIAVVVAGSYIEKVEY